MTQCAVCGKQIERYRCITVPGPHRWPVSAKACRECWQRWIAQAGRQPVSVAPGLGSAAPVAAAQLVMIE